jgi:alpha-galactosidase
MIVAGEGAWALQGEQSSYVIALDETGSRADLVHWGARLSDPLALVGRRHREAGSHKRPPADLAPVEYAPWGVRHVNACDLLPVHADGNRGMVWRFVGAAVEGEEVRLRFEDPRLAVTLHYRARPEWDVVERWAAIEHRGAESVVLERVAAAAFNVPLDAPATATYLSGAWMGELCVRETALPPGTFSIESRSGMTGHAFNPWMALRGDDGGAWAVALAWSGSWKLAAECVPEGGIRVVAGINDFDAPVTLGPGERHVTPVAAGVYGSEGLAGVRHRLHDYQRRALRPAPAEPLPVVYNSWEATHFGVDAGHQAELARVAAEIGCEVFVVDDGWFRGRSDDTAGLGDWAVDRGKFPDGLEALIGVVRSLGMRFGLWVEPEGVNPDSDLYRAHPDWVLGFPDRAATEIRHQLVLNLARPDAATWVRDTLLGLLDRYPISYLKGDMNRPFTEPGWAGADPGVARSVWVRYVESLYAILGELRRRHPGLLIEGCAGGGGRVDLGMLPLVDTCWASDNTGPLDRLRIQHGFLHAYAPRWMSSWVTDSPGRTRRGETSFEHRFCVAMAGVLGIGADVSGWDRMRVERARELIAQYKQVRRTIQEGCVDLHGAPDTGRPYGIQYTRADEVVLLTWWDRGLRHTGSLAPAGATLATDARLTPRPVRIPLAGLPPDATFQLHGTPTRLPASELTHAGLPIPWHLADDADLTVLHRIR